MTRLVFTLFIMISLTRLVNGKNPMKVELLDECRSTIDLEVNTNGYIIVNDWGTKSIDCKLTIRCSTDYVISTRLLVIDFPTCDQSEVQLISILRSHEIDEYPVFQSQPHFCGRFASGPINFPQSGEHEWKVLHKTIRPIGKRSYAVFSFSVHKLKSRPQWPPNSLVTTTKQQTSTTIQPTTTTAQPTFIKTQSTFNTTQPTSTTTQPTANTTQPTSTTTQPTSTRTQLTYSTTQPTSTTVQPTSTTTQTAPKTTTTPITATTLINTTTTLPTTMTSTTTATPTTATTTTTTPTTTTLPTTSIPTTTATPTTIVPTLMTSTTATTITTTPTTAIPTTMTSTTTTTPTTATTDTTTPITTTKTTTTMPTTTVPTPTTAPTTTVLTTMTLTMTTTRTTALSHTVASTATPKTTRTTTASTTTTAQTTSITIPKTTPPISQYVCTCPLSIVDRDTNRQVDGSPLVYFEKSSKLIFTISSDGLTCTSSVMKQTLMTKCRRECFINAQRYLGLYGPNKLVNVKGTYPILGDHVCKQATKPLTGVLSVHSQLLNCPGAEVTPPVYNVDPNFYCYDGAYCSETFHRNAAIHTGAKYVNCVDVRKAVANAERGKKCSCLIGQSENQTFRLKLTITSKAVSKNCMTAVAECQEYCRIEGKKHLPYGGISSVVEKLYRFGQYTPIQSHVNDILCEEFSLGSGTLVSTILYSEVSECKDENTESSSNDEKTIRMVQSLPPPSRCD